MLIYAALTSLDGYVEDEEGGFGWAEPDEEVHAFVTDRERGRGTHLYGRRLYETMVAWERPDDFAGDSAVMRDYAAIWQAADKVVYSRTLERVDSARTRIERDFDPAAVRALVDAADRDVPPGQEVRQRPAVLVAGEPLLDPVRGVDAGVPPAQRPRGRRPAPLGGALRDVVGGTHRPDNKASGGHGGSRPTRERSYTRTTAWCDNASEDHPNGGSPVRGANQRAVRAGRASGSPARRSPAGRPHALLTARTVGSGQVRQRTGVRP